MRYILAFLLKLVATVVILWITLGMIFNISFSNLFITSLILTVVAFAGDMLILPRIGNIAAAVGDFALAYIGIWVIGSFLYDSMLSLDAAALIAAFLITIGELFYHRYLRNFVFDNVDKDQNHLHSDNLQTEASEEFYDRKDKDE
ncbi:YndM family protein [Oceanobacillus sp. J11TS1]|uniref:YndM family protein n=1 Tax=Oceanobacillus sp. J11TS1 TaxID=2807191 RepID=UPI001B2F1208|nr:YndM family protein [Oceanobacillus sp. J11TS1]GIO24073.1 putative membrane protein YndM [Oceanobacillus sp. J11TS1]